MIFLLYLIFLQLLINACSNKIIENEKIIKRIESEISLPKSSNLLGEYSRFYSGDIKSIVHAVYIIQKIEDREFVKKVCFETNSLSYPCNDTELGIIKPNTTKWLHDSKNLPVQNGGGCSFIEIKYEVSTSKFLQIECNGPL
jgi:hypothetical protein